MDNTAYNHVTKAGLIVLLSAQAVSAMIRVPALAAGGTDMRGSSQPVSEQCYVVW